MSDRNIPNDQRAFPSPYFLPENVGLTKRELFSAMAMQALVTSTALYTSECAKRAVEHADALLAALEQSAK